MNPTIRKIFLSVGLYDLVVDFKHWLTREDSIYVSFYSQFVSKGDLCFDVGANVGTRTRALLKLGARVVAVEPVAHCAQILRRKYGTNTRVTLVAKAVGAEEGTAEMMVCDAHSLSSLSKPWVDSVKASGRYADLKWQRTVSVPMTTLDNLIGEYGKPAFIKIDVEGYEHDVLKGLSQSVHVLCFEFTPEFIDSAIRCVERLAEIGKVKFNYCLVDKPTTMVLSTWVSANEMRPVLEDLRGADTVGDIYARFAD
jgi:FkbM family methyltransferase